MKTESFIVGNWYVVNEIAPNVFWIREPGIVSFYLFKNNHHGLFIDSGLGLSEKAFRALLSHFDLQKFDIICTHAHSDHIGLNSFAATCKLSKIEWEKYLLQNEDKQLDYFLESLASTNSLPLILNEKDNRMVGNLPWTPSGFLQKGDIYPFHDWSFEVFESPGHTCGSLMFFERNLNFIFTGDLVYSGTMYLHLKDSNNVDFAHSLDLLIDIGNSHPGLKVWPAHNGIPLDLEFIHKTRSTLNLINKKLIESLQLFPKDKIFEAGQLFIHDSVKIITRIV